MNYLFLLKSMLYAKNHKKNKKRKMLKRKKNENKPICRICNQEKGIIPIFSDNCHPNIPEEIELISGITISKDDKFSKLMCQTCVDLLNGCILFRRMCLESNKRLIELAREEGVSVLDVRSSEVEIKNENVIEESNESSDNFLMLQPEDNHEILTAKIEFIDLMEKSDEQPECKQKSNLMPPKEVNKKRFLCDVCGKVAPSYAGLLMHKHIHENVFPFKCDVCPYQGRTTELLKVHKRSHLVDKPFKCTQCAKATTTASNLAKHMRHVHSTNRPFKCTYCEKGFSYQHALKRHIKDIHLRQGIVECDVCFKKFNTKKILQGHRWKIHKIKSERQGRLPSYLQCQIMGANKPTTTTD